MWRYYPRCLGEVILRNAICGVFLALVGLGLTGEVAAQTCGGLYAVKRGDSLSLIADSQYKDAGKWTAVHSINIDQIGQNPNDIRVGMTLRFALHRRFADRAKRGAGGGGDPRACGACRGTGKCGIPAQDQYSHW
ncbi:hypothetical protein [Roseovarius marisflavi]|uniref:LysM peptidoglycan-binding domain-containing protein n=1 Tax=Roseovarius marisflavi TaxID=1054996 RepID=UPI003183A2CB